MRGRLLVDELQKACLVRDLPCFMHQALDEAEIALTTGKVQRGYIFVVANQGICSTV